MIYILVAIMINQSSNETNISLDTVAFSTEAKCEQAKEKVRSKLEKQYNKVGLECYKRKIK